MHIDKISQNIPINEIRNAIGNRVLLDLKPDTFEKSGQKVSIKENYLEKFKNFVFSKKIAKEAAKKAKSLSYKYPHVDEKDLQALIIQARKLKQDPVTVLYELEKVARDLSDTYKYNVYKIRDFCNSEFSNIYSVDSVGARPKGKSSILSKLTSKYSKGKLDSVDVNELAKGIGDGYGARIVLKNLRPETAKKVIEKNLAGVMSYEDFVKNVKNIDSLDENTRKVVNKGLNKLKEYQTNEIVDKMVELLKKGTLQLADDEFNNYGNEITSYFTDTQLKRIAHNYEEITHKPLTIVNKNNLSNLKNAEETVLQDSTVQRRLPFVKTNPKKATKASGYTTTQANLKTNYTTGKPLADTEIQIRGKEVNNFAEIEHIPYDIRQGKNTPSEYEEIKTIMRGMSAESYDEYSKYLSDTYNYHRLKELGIDIQKPKLSQNLKWALTENLPKDLKYCVDSGNIIDAGLLNKITEEGLLALHK